MSSIVLVQVNRESVGYIPCNDRGFSYGDGVFETIRVSAGELTFSELHWARLMKGIRKLKIQVRMSEVLDDVSYFLDKYHPVSGVLKVIVTRGSSSRGYGIDQCHNRRIVIQLSEFLKNEAHLKNGVHVCLCSIVLGYSHFAGLKHLCRLEQVMARTEVIEKKFDEGICMDDEQYLIEGTMTNLFLLTNDNVILTPCLKKCGVEGVSRQYILQNASVWGYDISVDKVDMKSLYSAKEVFLVNSVNGVWPVVSFSSDMQWAIGEVTEDIRHRLDGVLDG